MICTIAFHDLMVVSGNPGKITLERAALDNGFEKSGMNGLTLAFVGAIISISCLFEEMR
jgi:hypothetical protein